MAYQGKKYMANRHSTGALAFYGLLAWIPMIIWFILSFLNSLHFKQECGGRLTRAANANSLEIAAEELEAAVAYLEKNNLTQGYTTIIASLRTPDEDIGFWYKNLNDALHELRNMPKTTTPLERSNVLIKLRETLISSEKTKDEIILPAGIQRYPHNLGWALSAIFFIFIAFGGLLVILYACNR